MSISEHIEAARDQLDRTMEFFSRVDGKASVLLAVNTSMLALLATWVTPVSSLETTEVVAAAVSALLIAASLWHVYREGFPALEGGEESHLYFRQIASRTEAKYAASWRQMTDQQYLDDLLGQIWRNSVILKQKFDHVRWALRLLALSLLPWCVALALLSRAGVQ